MKNKYNIIYKLKKYYQKNYNLYYEYYLKKQMILGIEYGIKSPFPKKIYFITLK